MFCEACTCYSCVRGKQKKKRKADMEKTGGGLPPAAFSQAEELERSSWAVVMEGVEGATRSELDGSSVSTPYNMFRVMYQLFWLLRLKNIMHFASLSYVQLRLLWISVSELMCWQFFLLDLFFQEDLDGQTTQAHVCSVRITLQESKALVSWQKHYCFPTQGYVLWENPNCRSSCAT